jgi:DNA polymerase V
VPYYHRSGTIAFPAYTNDTQQLLKAAGKEVGRLFQPGVKFYRCGVGLMEIVDAHQHQPDLFQPNQDRPALIRFCARYPVLLVRGGIARRP